MLYHVKARFILLFWPSSALSFDVRAKLDWTNKRVSLGLRKVELAEISGLSVRTIIRLEKGDPTITEETKSKARIALTNKTKELNLKVAQKGRKQ